MDRSGEAPPANWANPLRLGWILFGTAAWTMFYSVQVVFGVGSGAAYRRKVDRLARIWSRRLLDLVEATVEVEGDFASQLQPGKPVIVMCNHSSLYDIPISFLSLPGSLRMLAKKELFSIPVFSGALRRGEFLSIDRNDREQAVRDLERARMKMEDGILLWVAPEGTRSSDGKLRPFKRGAIRLAIQTGATVIPIAIRNSYEIQPGKRVGAVLGKTVNVVIGDAIDAATYSMRQRTELATDIRASMLTMLGQED